MVLAVLAMAFTTPVSGQIELRPHQQDPFSTIDRLGDERYSREDLANVSVDGDVLDAVRLLDSDDYAVREQATAQLLADRDRRVQLYALLAVGSISTEQRYRLLEVVREQLVNAPRGALGVQMEQQFLGRGGPIEIKIVDLIAGLPAERALQVGDRIVAIDGNPLFSQDDLQSRIQAKGPGDVLSVTVKRPKVDDNGKIVKDEQDDPVVEVLTFDLRLGPAELLDKRNRQQGLNVRVNRIESERRRNAEAITFTYAPNPRVIRINGNVERLAGGDEIDRHPVIETLRMQMELLDQVNDDQARMIQDSWRRELANLREMARHPAFSADERELFRRVADRYMQVMNAGS
jgi:hypothetical protein